MLKTNCMCLKSWWSQTCETGSTSQDLATCFPCEPGYFARFSGKSLACIGIKTWNCSRYDHQALTMWEVLIWSLRSHLIDLSWKIFRSSWSTHWPCVSLSVLYFPGDPYLRSLPPPDQIDAISVKLEVYVMFYKWYYFALHPSYMI